MPNPIYRLYYDDFYHAFHIGSYTGFIRGFCSPFIANYLLNSPIYINQNYERIFQARLMIRNTIRLGIENSQLQYWFDRMNKSHQTLKLPDEHFLYAIANFVIEPIKIIRSRLKQRLNINTMAAFLNFWFTFAQKMSLQFIPQTLGQWISLRNQYELKYNGCSPAQQKLLKMSLSSTCKLLAPIGFRKLLAQMIIWQLPNKFCNQFQLTKYKFTLPLVKLLF